MATSSWPSERDQQAQHRRLARLNRSRLSPTWDAAPALAVDYAAEVELRKEEAAFLQAECANQDQGLRTLPSDPSQFVGWFRDLAVNGPGQNDPLFPWLEHQATLGDFRWFLAQEIAGEAGFEDLLALTQLKMPRRIKLEMARNFWDELGRGGEAGMHGPLLDRLAQALEVGLPLDEIVWPALALSNLMVGLAWNRHYAYQALGALGVIELTAPGRAAHVNEGLRRLGVAAGDRKYYALHATLDVQHARAWCDEVLAPLVGADPRLMRPLAQGALMRLSAGSRCFARYRQHVGLAA